MTILAAWEMARCTLAVDRAYERYRRPYRKDRPEPWRSVKTVGSVDGRDPAQAWRSRRARVRSACDNERRVTPTRRSTVNNGLPRSLRAACADVDYARLPSSTRLTSGGQGRVEVPTFRSFRERHRIAEHLAEANVADLRPPRCSIVSTETQGMAAIEDGGGAGDDHQRRPNRGSPGPLAGH